VGVRFRCFLCFHKRREIIEHRAEIPAFFKGSESGSTIAPSKPEAVLCFNRSDNYSEAPCRGTKYRVLKPVPAAEKAFLAWIDELDRKFTKRDSEHRSDVVREALHELYLGSSYAAADPAGPLAIQTLIHSFDPAQCHAGA